MQKETDNADYDVMHLPDSLVNDILAAKLKSGIRVKAWTDNSNIHASTSELPLNATLFIDEGEGL